MLVSYSYTSVHDAIPLQLRQEQAQMQETLRQAEDIRWAKEGEVTILRKGIQKVCIYFCSPTPPFHDPP